MKTSEWRCFWCERAPGDLAFMTAHAMTCPRDPLVMKLHALEEWAHKHGKALVPTAGSSDSFGDGMREAKKQVATLLRCQP